MPPEKLCQLQALYQQSTSGESDYMVSNTSTPFILSCNGSPPTFSIIRLKIRLLQLLAHFWNWRGNLSCVHMELICH